MPDIKKDDVFSLLGINSTGPDLLDEALAGKIGARRARGDQPERVQRQGDRIRSSRPRPSTCGAPADRPGYRTTNSRRIPARGTRNFVSRSPG